VASPVYDACANFIEPAINGQIAPGSALQQFQAELQSDLEQ
jgi:hypothetical protein